MDKLQKALAKLPARHKRAFEFIMLRLWSRDFVGLKIARLKGHKDIYRVKHGDLRVVFKMNSNQLLVMQAGLRSEKTYKKL